MNALLHSRKFLTLILDTVVSVATYFIGKYAGASSQDMLYLIAALQPVVLAMIVGTAVEDAAEKRAGIVTRS